MKQFIIAVFAVITTAAATAFPTSSPAVPEKTLAAFQKEFAGAVNANWLAVEDISIVSFELNSQRVAAWFSAEGELGGFRRSVQAGQMTLAASQAVAQLAAEQTIFSITEVSEKNEIYYLVKTANEKFKTTYRIYVDGTAVKESKKKVK
jgi:hypothetical protein